MKCFAVCCVVLCLCHGGHPHNASYHQTFFVDQLFQKYGHNDVMTFEGFEHLLENLGIGRLKFQEQHDVEMHRVNGTFRDIHDELELHEHDHSTQGESENGNEGTEESTTNTLSRERRSVVYKYMPAQQRCLSPQDILSTYGLEPNHGAVISPLRFQEICPAIVYELDHKSCWADTHLRAVRDEEQQEYYWVWIYASISIIVMSAAGLLCVAVVPVVHKSYYKHLLQFLVALAVGTLCGDALIHLLPSALSAGPSESPDTPVFRGTVCLLAIVIFYTIETILKAVHDRKQERTELEDRELNLTCEGRSHGHSHGGGVDGKVDPVAWMIIMGDVLHNISDGLSIGAAFSSKITAGLASSIAIFCHELPHELGDYAVLLKSGMSVKRALLYNLLSSIFSFLGMVGGVLLGEIEFASLWINAFTAGSFLYIALSDLIPEMKAEASSKPGLAGPVIQLVGFILGAVLMFSIALYEDSIEGMFD